MHPFDVALFSLIFVGAFAIVAGFSQAAGLVMPVPFILGFIAGCIASFSYTKSLLR